MSVLASTAALVFADSCKSPIGAASEVFSCFEVSSERGAGTVGEFTSSVSSSSNGDVGASGSREASPVFSGIYFNRMYDEPYIILLTVNIFTGCLFPPLRSI